MVCQRLRFALTNQSSSSATSANKSLSPDTRPSRTDISCCVSASYCAWRHFLSLSLFPLRPHTHAQGLILKAACISSLLSLSLFPSLSYFPLSHTHSHSRTSRLPLSHCYLSLSLHFLCSFVREFFGLFLCFTSRHFCLSVCFSIRA